MVIDEGTQQVKPGAKAKAKLHDWKPGSNAAPPAGPAGKFSKKTDGKPAAKPAAAAEKKVK